MYMFLLLFHVCRGIKTHKNNNNNGMARENYMHERISSLSKVANQRSLSCLSYYMWIMLRVGFSIAQHMIRKYNSRNNNKKNNLRLHKRIIKIKKKFIYMMDGNYCTLDKKRE